MCSKDTIITLFIRTHIVVLVIGGHNNKLYNIVKHKIRKKFSIYIIEILRDFSLYSLSFSLSLFFFFLFFPLFLFFPSLFSLPSPLFLLNLLSLFFLSFSSSFSPPPGLS